VPRRANLDRASGALAEQRGDAGVAERRQRQAPHGRVAGEPREPGAQVELARAGGHRQPHGEAVEAAAEHCEQVERVVVGPVRVVGGDDERAVMVAERADHGDQSEQAPRSRLRRVGGAGSTVLQHRFRRCTRPGETALPQTGLGRGEQPPCPAEGVRALELGTPHRQHRQVARLGLGLGGRQHGGLPDSGRSLDQQGGADAIAHAVERIRDDGELLRALVHPQSGRLR
jgi:hypothetical protein